MGGWMVGGWVDGGWVGGWVDGWVRGWMGAWVGVSSVSVCVGAGGVLACAHALKGLFICLSFLCSSYEITHALNDLDYVQVPVYQRETTCVPSSTPLPPHVSCLSLCYCNHGD